MNDFAKEIAEQAANAVEMCNSRSGGGLDCSEKSLAIVEEMLDEIAQYADQMDGEQVDTLVKDFGSYLFEVARREFGGKFYWHDAREQPVLVVGEPTFRVALLTFDRVRSRLDGDPADNIPFFYSGFADQARSATAGTDSLYV
jgi:hypothetical protein